MELICWSLKHSSKPIRKLVTSGFAFLILIILTAVRPLYSQTPISEFQFKKVADIQIQADGPVDRPFLIDLIEITPNVDILTTSKIRKSIELLYETGNFTNILVDAKPVGDRVSLTFILRLVYRFDFVHLKGNTAASGRIRKKIQLRKLEPYTPEKVLHGRDDVLTVLHENGYYLARVTTDVLLHRVSKRADVTYNIQAGPPAYVNSVVFSGQPHFSRAVVLARMKSKPGKRFREPELSRDLEKIEELYDINGFLEHDIRLEKKDFLPPNRINLIIHLDAGKQLLIETAGYRISTTQLREIVPIWADHSYNDDTLEEGKRNLIHYLQTQGYFDAQVNWTKNISAEKILIKYTFEPGIRYEVRNISIEGNRHLSIKEIKSVMLTRETGFLGAQRLVTKTFVADIGRILGAYREHGFLFANVTKRDIVRSAPDAKIDIHLGIEEGPQVMLAEIRMKGNTVIQTSFFLEHFKLKVGEPISESKVKADSNYIVALYSDRGYPKIHLENKLLLSRDKTKALVEYRITEGEQIFVDRIVLNGNYRTVRGVITENLLFHEDDPLSLRKIAASQSKLYSLEIFDRVDMEVPRPDNLQKRQNVVIKVTESKPYTISYGFGYQTFDLLRGVFAISDKNLFGTDRIAALQLRGGIKEGRALITYSDPHLFYHKFDSTFSGFAEKRSIRTTFAFRRYGVSLQTERRLSADPSSLELGKPIPPITSLFLRYDFEDIITYGTPSLSPLDRQFLAIHISSVTGSFVRDARDNIIDPTKGTFFSNELQFATSALGSGTDFLKNFSQFQYYFPVRRDVIATSLRLGLARGFKETVKLPLSQRFFAGGGRTIRGFDLDTAGPLDEFGNPLGGNALFILNLEYRFPVYRNLGALVFFDWGSTFPLVSDFEISGLRKTTGLGLRYKTPIGPLALDWGYKLDRRLTPIRESPSEFFISVGHAF